MGTSQSKPKTKTGRTQANQKMETAQKTGVLSLREHNLESIPSKVFDLLNLTTLDMSNNKLKVLPLKLSVLTKLKSINVENNSLHNLQPITKLDKLQTLTAGKNRLGLTPPSPSQTNERLSKSPSSNHQSQSKPQEPLPKLPSSLKQIKLNANHFTSIPDQLMSGALTKLVKLDLSHNNIASIPAIIAGLSSLTELNLSHNTIPSVCPEIANLKKLKSLSLEYNAIQVTGTIMKWTEQNPQPLPRGLFEETALTDLNLKGNKLTNTQLGDFHGFDSFLERRQKMKSKTIYGGAMTDLGICGLE